MDKRRSPRFPVTLAARFRSETAWIDGRVGNLSQGGMLFLGPAPFPDGLDLDEADAASVILELDLPDSEKPLAIAGPQFEVRWREARGAAGIRFIELAISARRRLANLILRVCAGS